MTKDEFTKGWKHFCDCIDFGRSNLDAESIRFMNEAPAEITALLDTSHTTEAHYKSIAKIIKQAARTDRDYEPEITIGENNRRMWLIENLANYFEQDNTLFNRDNFVKACGLK